MVQPLKNTSISGPKRVFVGQVSLGHWIQPMGIMAIILAGLAGCSGDDKKSKMKEVTDDSGGQKSEEHFELKDSDGGGNTSAARGTLTQSLSNNPLTSQTIDISKASQLVEKMQSGKGKGFYEEKLSAERLARRGVGPVTISAKKIASFEMEKGASNTISEAVKLEIALAAVAARNYYLAEFLLPVLIESKAPKIKAAANNALGVMAYQADRVPEAVLYFKEALKAVENYKPAMLNLGLAALKGGDLNVAKRYLGDLQNDWFVQSNLIIVSRLEGNNSRAGDLCASVLAKEPDHKATLFNCGLFELQNRGAFDKARKYAEKASKARHGEAGWDERAFQLSNQIDMEEAAKKLKAAQKAAADKPKQSPKPQANPTTNPAAGGQKPAQGP